MIDITQPDWKIIRLSRPDARWLRNVIAIGMTREGMHIENDRHTEFFKLRSWLGGAANLNINEVVSFTVEIS